MIILSGNPISDNERRAAKTGQPWCCNAVRKAVIENCAISGVATCRPTCYTAAMDIKIAEALSLLMMRINWNLNDSVVSGTTWCVT